MGSVGEKLRQARESSGRSIRELSDLTKIRSDHLEALEAGDYHAFSAPVYIRGFVRSYAGALKLNVAQTLLELDNELVQDPRFKEPPPLSQESKGALDFLMLKLSKINWTVALPLLLLALLLLIAIVGYRAYKHSQSTDPLKNLGPGLYQGTPPGETLPIPSSTNR